MDFTINDKTRRLRDEIRDFMDAHIYPIEEDVFEFNHDPRNLWVVPPRIEELKEIARSRGLWNLFLPHEYGDYSPGLTNLEYAPLAEEMGLIIQLSEWVIEAVCRQVAEWRDRGLPRQSVAINLSAAHFRFAGLVDTVTGILDRYGLDGHDIEFELTESALLGDPELASQILADLHRRGLKVAVDDFGTGYSSLAYLKRFRLNTLKIDRSFVRDMEVDRSDVAIISSIVAMAETLGLGLVAEGVETINQARHLMSVGCHVMQGYLFAPALPAEAYAALLSGALETLTSLPPIEA